MWTCPNCETRVEPTLDVCWNCGTSAEGVADPTFVRADDAGPINDPVEFPPRDTGKSPMGELVEAYRALDVPEATFLADQLHDRGIPATADTQDLSDSLGGIASGPRVWVAEADLPKARAWLETYERDKRLSGGS